MSTAQNMTHAINLEEKNGKKRLCKPQAFFTSSNTHSALFYYLDSLCLRATFYKTSSYCNSDFDLLTCFRSPREEITLDLCLLSLSPQLGNMVQYRQWSIETKLYLELCSCSSRAWCGQCRLMSVTSPAPPPGYQTTPLMVVWSVGVFSAAQMLLNDSRNIIGML